MSEIRSLHTKSAARIRAALFIWASLNIRRAEDREKIFRQMKQDSARVVNPTRRNFVKYGEKDSAEISCDEFLEMPYISIRSF